MSRKYLERLTQVSTSLLLVLFGISLGAVEYGIASQYVRDVGIKNNSAIVFTEDFEASSIDMMLVNWPFFRYKDRMSLSPDKPVNSGGSKSLYVSGGWMDMYKKFAQGYDTLYARFYTKLDPSCVTVHHWPWMGGHYPATDGPNPRAGDPPNLATNICYNYLTREQRTDLTNCGPSPWYITGNTINRISTGVEAHGSGDLRWDFYTYWKDMHASGDGYYWGNNFASDLGITITKGQWVCIEFMMKLNSPVSDSNGEQAFWINGEKKVHLGKGFPMGRWYTGAWLNTGRSLTPFPGFQWRNTTDLKINYFWLEHFVDTDMGCEAWFDDIVIAKKYIGPQVTQTIGIKPELSPAKSNGSFNARNIGGNRIRFDLPLQETGSFEFRVLDLSGRELLLHRGTAEASGQYDLAWQGAKNLSAGIYTGQLSQGKATRSWRFSVIP